MGNGRSINKGKPPPRGRRGVKKGSRKRYLEGFTDNSSYSAAVFVQNAVKYFKYPVKCVQTDNGQEFTKTFSPKYSKTKEFAPTLFQQKLMELGIEHKQIRPYTPRHNGKVERSHRKDNERFYSRHTFYSLEDFNNQLRRYMNDSRCAPGPEVAQRIPRTILF